MSRLAGFSSLSCPWKGSVPIWWGQSDLWSYLSILQNLSRERHNWRWVIRARFPSTAGTPEEYRAQSFTAPWPTTPAQSHGRPARHQLILISDRVMQSYTGLSNSCISLIRGNVVCFGEDAQKYRFVRCIFDEPLERTYLRLPLVLEAKHCIHLFQTWPAAQYWPSRLFVMRIGICMICWLVVPFWKGMQRNDPRNSKFKSELIRPKTFIALAEPNQRISTDSTEVHPIVSKRQTCNRRTKGKVLCGSE